MTASRGHARARAEASIGEPLLADDPLITSSQAAALLHDTRQRVQRLARAGILTTHPGHHHRRYRISDVAHLAEPITVHEAIQLLGCTTDQLGTDPHPRTSDHRQPATPRTPLPDPLARPARLPTKDHELRLSY